MIMKRVCPSLDFGFIAGCGQFTLSCLSVVRKVSVQLTMGRSVFTYMLPDFVKENKMLFNQRIPLSEEVLTGSVENASG